MWGFEFLASFLDAKSKKRRSDVDMKLSHVKSHYQYGLTCGIIVLSVLC